MANIQLQEEAIPPIQTAVRSHSRHGFRAPLKLLARCVSTKLEEGDYRGAGHTACSDDTIADISEKTISILKAKHPLPHPDFCVPQSPGMSVPTFAVSEDIVQAIRSFPSGSAGGPDGLRPQHLSDLTRASAECGGKELIQALTLFTNHILNGNVVAWLSVSSASFIWGHSHCPEENRRWALPNRSGTNTMSYGGQVCFATCHAHSWS